MHCQSLRQYNRKQGEIFCSQNKAYSPSSAKHIRDHVPTWDARGLELPEFRSHFDLNFKRLADALRFLAPSRRPEDLTP